MRVGVLLDRLGDRLAIGHLRLADGGVHRELPQHPVDDDLQVELAHPGDDGLVGLLVGADLEGRVFLRQGEEGLAHLVLVDLRLGLHGHVDHGLGELEVLQHDLGARGRQGIAGTGVLEADARRDVAGEHGVDVLAAVGVHLQDAADALLVAVGGVHHRAALLQRAGVDAEVDELADVRVGHDLEGQRRERLVVGGLALELLVTLDVHALGGREIDRAWEVVHDGVEQGLHALVLERGAVQDRHDLAGDGAGANGAAQVGDGDLLLADELLEDVLVEAGEDVDELGAVLVSLVPQVGGDLLDVPLGTELLVVPDEGLHGDEVDDALVVALGADGQLEDGAVGAEAVLDGGEGGVEVCAQAVHLVDEAHAGHAVLVGLSPHGLGLGLHASHTVEHRHRTVEHAEGPLHLDGEVNVARGVDDVDVVVAPLAGGGRRGDGDAPLLLLGHPVHDGGAFVHLTDLVALARVVEDALGRRGLARVDVGHDPDVADSLEGVVALHVCGVLSLHANDRAAPGRPASGGGGADYQR